MNISSIIIESTITSKTRLSSELLDKIRRELLSECEDETQVQLLWEFQRRLLLASTVEKNEDNPDE